MPLSGGTSALNLLLAFVILTMLWTRRNAAFYPANS